MMSNKTFGTIIAAVFTLAAAIPASAAPNSSDACSLLSQSQISAAVGKQVGAGTWMTPSFKATCNWTAPGVIVTLMTEGVDKYQAGKTPISPMMQIVAAGGIGDDAYYVVTGTIAMLYTKKGSVAFKTSVYSKLPIDTLKKIESTLATQVASEL
jgi:hypothetical protein